MGTTARVTTFGTLYVILFVAAMYVITGGVIDIAAWASAPIVMSAEAMVLGMIYMTTFHGEGEEHAAVSSHRVIKPAAAGTASPSSSTLKTA